MAGDDRATVAALDAARAVFREQIEAQQGRVIDMAGDSVLAVFGTAAGAVPAALAIQREVNALADAEPEDRRMHFRIGVHLGDVIENPVVASATGFAPIKSIVEDAFHRGVRRPMQLYWGVRRREDLYLLELAERWQREHANFRVVPVLSDSVPGDGWSGRRGLVHEAMLADHPDLSGCEVYACGSVRMVEVAVPAMLAQGLGEEFCFSDAFVAAPPPTAEA